VLSTTTLRRLPAAPPALREFKAAYDETVLWTPEETVDMCSTHRAAWHDTTQPVDQSSRTPGDEAVCESRQARMYAIEPLAGNAITRVQANPHPVEPVLTWFFCRSAERCGG